MLIIDCLYKNIWLSVLLFPLANIALSIFSSETIGLGHTWCFWLQQLAIGVGVALAEELFFRGLLLRELVFSYKWRPVTACLLVSFAFGVLHLVNVNSYATWCYASVQSFCAFVVSFNLSGIFLNTQKLWLCVLIHALINITSLGLDASSNEAQLVLSNMEIMAYLSVASVYLVSGIKMLNRKIAEGK